MLLLRLPSKVSISSENEDERKTETVELLVKTVYQYPVKNNWNT